MTLSAVIPHFYAARVRHLHALIASLRAGSLVPDEIIVWNNDRPMGESAPLGVEMIQSPRNVGAQARFLAALMARGDDVLFLDNDLVLKPETVAQMRIAMRALDGQTMVTLQGYDIPPGGRYTAKRKVRTGIVTVPERVTVSLGRAELVRRVTLLRLLSDWPCDETSAMDDLWLSAAAHRHGVPMWVGPTDGYTDAPVQDGYERRPGHYDERDRVFQYLRSR